MICFNVNRKNYRDLVQIYLPKDNCISLGYFKGLKNKKLWYLGVNDTCYMIRKNLFWWSHVLQGWLYKHHIYWHNWIIDECCPGFECCANKVKDPKMKQLLKDLHRAIEEQISGCYYSKEKGHEK